MRILITGIIVFIIWSIFSVWLYVQKLKPEKDEPVTEQTVQSISESQPVQADSIIQQEVIIPDDLIIYFGFDESKFKSGPQIDEGVTEFKNWLDKNQESMLLITGHTDNKGTAEYNQVLGLERAQSVKNYFQSKDVDAAVMKIDSKGESQPINDQITEEDRAKNRRVVITIKN